jgi:glucans biosynthesis protein C
MDDTHAASGLEPRLLLANAQGRLPGLEELRAMAAVLVVALHAGIPYLKTRMIAVVWPTFESRPSALVDAFFWCIECFIMPLFFMLSGWSAATLLKKHVGWEFLSDRTRRILLPLIVGSFLALPFMMYVWATGWIVFQDYPFHKYLSLRFDGEIRGNFWGFAHLWYLEYLYIYCLVLALVAWAMASLGLGRSPRSGGRFALLPGGMMAAGAIILTWDNRIVLGFYQTFHPVLSKLLYYGIYFCAGLALKSLPVLQEGAKRHFARFGLTAAGTFCVVLPLIHARSQTGLGSVERAALGLALAVFGVCTSLAIFGFFLTRQRPARPWVLAISEASLWIYIMHMPTVGLVHIDLATWQGPTVVKYLLTWLAAMVWTLLTYEGFVRKTWLGKLLHGERKLAQRGFSITTLRTMLSTSRSRAA